MNYVAKCKQRLLEVFGYKCSICGYDRCIQSLSFHHVNTEDKLFTISSWKVRNWTKIANEAKKCILICSNCHAEIHSNIIKCPELDKQIIEKIENLKLKKYENLAAKKSKCLYCDNLKTSRTDFCSTECFIKYKSNKIFTKSEFINEFNEQGIKFMMKKYQCSDVTIYKYIKTINPQQS